MAYEEVANPAEGSVWLASDIQQIAENVRWLYDERPRYFYQRDYGDADYTSTSAMSAFEDIDATNLVANITTTGNPVRIRLSGFGSISANSRALRFEFLIDGSPLSNDTTYGLFVSRTEVSNQRQGFHVERVVELAAGAHTIKAQWYCPTADTYTIFSSSCIQFEVYEI